MLSWLGKRASSCLSPSGSYSHTNKDNSYDDEISRGRDDALIWSKDLEKHSCGEFSFAIVQANTVLEDQSQVECGLNGTFIGIYDGHGGPDASKYISEHLFGHFQRHTQENGTMSEGVLRNAVSDTENGFLTLVRRAYAIKPLVASMGSCCLVGVIWEGRLYIANLGDSRAVIAYLDRSDRIVAEQLTVDHNACMEEVRKELQDLHPDDSQILVMKHGVWRIKGIIQVSRTIGDAYLKRPEFSLDPSFPRFHLSEPLRRPVLRADPTIVSRDFQPKDRFLIFASDGLWEYLSNQEVVEIVHNSPRLGIARRLVMSALEKAAKTRQVPYDEIKKLDLGVRRHVHDDITIIVVFIDHEMLQNQISSSGISVRGFVDDVGPSNFTFP